MDETSGKDEAAPAITLNGEGQKSGSPTIDQLDGTSLERTLAIIKPNVVSRADEIAEIIEDNGFSIIRRQRFLLQPEQWCEFYAEHYGKSFFMSMCTFMASGPAEALVLTKSNAIEEWQSLLGPTDVAKAQEEAPESLRALYGDELSNGLHGSDSPATAVREIRYFFQGNIQESTSPDDEDIQTYLKRTVMPFMRVALAELCKAKPENCIEWLADYMKTHNPNRQLVNVNG